MIKLTPFKGVPMTRRLLQNGLFKVTKRLLRRSGEEILENVQADEAGENNQQEADKLEEELPGVQEIRAAIRP